MKSEKQDTVQFGLTERQKSLLEFLRSAQAEGRNPTYEDMMRALGLMSKSGIHRLVLALEERGYIKRLPRRARSIAVL